MGSTFLVPWTWLDNDANSVKNYGFKTAAMALSENSVSIDYPPLRDIPKLALIMGTEGDGLNQKTILASDFVVKVPMFHNVDSLNVASAAAVAFWELRNR
jgi:tRNA G18 (ribose-2'-O)-methylase SpoU